MGLVRLLLGVAGCGTGDDKHAASVKQGRESGPLSFLAPLAFENLGLSLVRCPGQSTTRTLPNRSCNALGTSLTELTPPGKLKAFLGSWFGPGQNKSYP